MTDPAIALERFGGSLVLGLALGFWYDFLRPPRSRRPHLWDGIFFPGALYLFALQGFGICRGDLRLGYTAGFFLGALLWSKTLGRALRPLISQVWQILGKPWRFFRLPLKKIWIFAKFLFASGEKWVTIKSNNRQSNRRASGGRRHGRKEKSPAQCAGKISPQQTPDKSGGYCRYRIDYGGAAHPALGSERN